MQTKYLVLVVLIIVSFTGLFSPYVVADDGWQYKLDFGYGSRSDELAFVQDGQLSGALSGNTSTVTFAPDDVEQWQFGYRFISDNLWYVKGHYNKGWVYSGSMQQSSYQNGSASSPWATYKANGLRGSTRDKSFAIGRQIRWQPHQHTIAITPLAGYANSYQDWQTTGGQQTTCTSTGQQVCMLSANVSNNEEGHWYSEWSGPWYGIDVRLNHQQWTWSLAWEHHRIHYDARLSWSGGQTLSGTESIVQSGLGHGNRYLAGLAYWVDNGFINVQISDTKFDLSSGSSESTSTTGIASAQSIQSLGWQSRAITLGYTGRF